MQECKRKTWFRNVPDYFYCKFSAFAPALLLLKLTGEGSATRADSQPTENTIKVTQIAYDSFDYLRETAACRVASC